MEEAARKRIAEYVRPLAVGVDGMTYSGDFERVVAAAQTMAGDRSDLDRDLLFLLAVFSGQEKWVEKMGHGSRTQIFLSSLGVPEQRIRALFRGLTRLTSGPRTSEEEIVHDAIALGELGAHGVARRLQDGYRERMGFLEMAASIEEGSRAAFKTREGEALAAERRRTMLDFARRLREEREEFSGSTGRRQPEGSVP